MFFRYLWMNTLTLFSKRRWIAVPIFAAGMALLVVGEFAGSAWGLGPANQWDIMLAIFNDPFKVALLFPVLFFTMTVDVFTEELDGWGYLVWNRGQSRRAWWWSKIGTIGLAAFLYTSITVLVVLLVGGLAAGMEATWSQLVFLSGWSYPGGMGIQHVGIPPFLVMLQLWLLLTWGLFALGTAVAVFAWVFRHTGAAWILGALMSILSYAVWNESLPFELAPWAPTLQLLLMAHAGFNSGVPANFTIGWSLIADTLLLGAAASAGLATALKRNL